MPVDALKSQGLSTPPLAAPGTKVAAPGKTAAAVEELTPEHSGADVEEAVRAAAKQIESFLNSAGRALEFRVDSTTGRTVVTVRNSQTGDVVRQIPSEEVLELARHLQQQRGALVSIAV